MKSKSFITIFFFFVLFSCGNSSSKLSNYKFVITGTFGTTISPLNNTFSNVVNFTDPDGNNHEWSNVKKDWSYSWSQTRKKTFRIFVSNISGIGDITINLYKDNELIDSKTGFNGAAASILY